ncbi:MAG TPA: hypothetical protein PLQ75_02220, partial [Anaerolineales bacterium]|nr:hypothetical protein [Anaerolineales bacterium]
LFTVEYKRSLDTMSEIDKRNVLGHEVFSYKISKEKKVFVYWRGKQVLILRGSAAQKFTSKIIGLDDKRIQLVLAKLTGNFKRGNER